MPGKENERISKELIEQKVNLVVEKLMNPWSENEAELKTAERAISFFKRDFESQMGRSREELDCTAFSK